MGEIVVFSANAAATMYFHLEKKKKGVIIQYHIQTLGYRLTPKILK